MANSNNLDEKLKKAKNYLKNGDLNEAESIYEDILENYPSSKVALKGLKKLRKEQKSAKLKNNDAEFSMEEQNAVASLYNQGDALTTLNEVSRLSKVYPTHPFIYNMMGICFRDLNDNKNAINCYVKALEYKNNYSEVYYNLANTLKSEGRIDEAIMTVTEGIKQDNSNINLYVMLATLKQIEPKSDELKAIKELVASADNYQDKIQLNTTLFEIYEGLDKKKKAFKYLETANSLGKEHTKYDIEHHKIYFSLIKEIFEQKVSPLDESLKTDNEKEMLFVVGMPQSGNKTVSKIFQTNENILNIGVSNLLNSIVDSFLMEKNDNTKLDQDIIKAIYDIYKDSVSKFNSDKPIYLDISSNNFIFLGFIMAIFPNAKIIHTIRDPYQNCCALYKNNFLGAGFNYTSDMDDIVEFYKLYSDIISFWKERYPNNIYDISYDNLLNDEKNEIKKLFNFCNLELNSEVSDITKNKDNIYTDNIRKFEDYFKPIKKKLLKANLL